MIYFIISSLALSHFIITNLGLILFYIIKLFSWIQLRLIISLPKTSQFKLKMLKSQCDASFDCLIGNSVISCTLDDALEKINGSDLTVLNLDGNLICFYPPVEAYYPSHEVSNVQFISVRINIGSVEYNLKLETPEYSFYVIGNELNVDWVRYYFIKFLHITLTPEVEYEMSIVDDNVQFITLTQYESLVFEKDDYELFSYIENKDADDGLRQGQQQNQDTGDELVLSDDEIEDELEGELEGEEIEVEVEVGRMIEIEQEVLKEQRQQEQKQQEQRQQVQDQDDELDRIIAEYDLSNIVIFRQETDAE
jgi:hypothetical protein